MALTDLAFHKRYRSSYETPSSSSSPALPVRKRYQGTSELILDNDSDGDKLGDEDTDEDGEDEGLDADDEGHGTNDEGHGSDDKVRSVESDRHGLEEEEFAPKGQPQAALVVEKVASEPLGLGYGTLRRRELAVEEDQVHSTFEVGQGYGSVPEPKRQERVSTLRQPTLTKWIDPEDGIAYIDVPAYPPLAPPAQTPPSPKWSSTTISVDEDQFIEVGAQLELYGGRVTVLAPGQPIPHVDRTANCKSVYRSSAISERPSYDSSSTSLSRKRSRSPVASVPLSSPTLGALSYACTDLPPSPKRIRSPETATDLEDCLKDSFEPYVPREVGLELTSRMRAEIDECIAYADALRDRGINARVVVEAIDREEIKMGMRGLVEVRVDRVTHLVSSNTVKTGPLIGKCGGEEVNGNGGNRNRGNGNEGVVGLTRWFEKMKTLFYISNCPEKYQVKYASCMLLNSALTWWNSHKRTIGIEAAYAMSWVELMKLMTEVYCPRNEVQKMETELWNLVVKGNDLTAYTRRF
ncbi:reverse transcriptase domain-containing protein [Tanacetum coccineum]